MGTSRQHRSTQEATPGLAAPSTGSGKGAQGRVGNAAVAERLSGGDLYATLRERVGDALADLILEHLSEDDLLSYVTPSIEALVGRAREESATSDHGLSDADLETAFSELDQKLTLAAAQLFGRLQADQRLAQVVKDQPELALAAALAGVVLWALTNPDLPAFSLKKGLGGGHALKGTVDLGRLQSLAVERLAVEWSWSSDDTSAKLEGFADKKKEGWGAKGSLAHTFKDGATLDAAGRYFHGKDHQAASGRVAYDGEHTDASLEGDWKSGLDGTEWGLGALLTHDGPNTQGSLEARLAQDAAGERTGSMVGSLNRQKDNWTANLSGQAGTDGSWSTEGGLTHSNAARDISVRGTAGRDANGNRSASAHGSYGSHGGDFRTELAADLSSDRTWNAAAGLHGTQSEQPWSLTGTLGRSALDTEADWSVTGRYGRALDKDGRTVLAGSQMVGRDRSSTKLDLTHNWQGGSASGWVERSRSALGTTDALGGSLEAQVGDNLRAYGQGWVRSDDTWDVSAGIRSGTEEDQNHWFAEGFSAKDQFGQADQGVRAGFRMRF